MDFFRRYLLKLCCLILVLAGESIQAEEEWFSDRMLRKLYDRSDLIIDATILEDVDGGMGGGGVVSEGGWRRGHISCVARVWIHEVLKGSVDPGSPLLIEVTLPFFNKGELVPVLLNEPIPVQNSTKPLLSKCDRAVFFLEDRLKREPNSEHSVDGETVKFRSFDFWFWRLPAEPALTDRLSIWRDEAGASR